MRSFFYQPFQWLASIKYQVVMVAMLVCIRSSTNPAHAGLLIDIAPNSADLGIPTTLEVILTNTGTGPLDQLLVAGFSFEMSAGAADITFLDVTTGTSNPYIFGGNSLFGPNILLNISPDGHTVSASDNFSIASSGVTLTPGETVGLGLVSFSVNSGICWIPLAFSASPSTVVNDPLGAVLPLALSNTGGINLIPEPSTLISLVLGLLGLVGARRIHRRTAVNAS